MTIIGFLTCTVNIVTFFAILYIMVAAFESKRGNSTLRDAVSVWLITMPLTICKIIFNDFVPHKYLIMVSILVVMFLYLHFCMEGHVWQKILFILLMEMDLFLGEVLCMVLFSNLTSKLTVWDINDPVILMVDTVINLTGIGFFWILLFVWKRFIMKNNCQAGNFIVFMFFPLGQVLLLISHADEFYAIRATQSFSLISGIIVGLLADILLLATILRQQQMREIELKLGEMKQTWEVEKKHYEEIENRREELAKIRHDMNEQFILMKELLKQDDRDKVGEMLDTLTAYVASTREYVYCGDPVVNAIMAENEKLCEEKQIKLAYEFDISVPLKMNPVAICSIFTNLFRNAIAAAEQTEGEKFISIKAALKGEYLHIKEENSYNPKAKKKDERKGYGTEILKSLVKQHNGQMEVSAEDEVYRVEMSVENRDVEG
ncbi:MAG: sensor histidine kinase [Lachnospiraceae bacterium]